MSMSDKIVANLTEPIPILKQDASAINTNPFIPNEQRERELTIIQSQANKIVEDAYKQNKTSSITNLTLQQIGNNISGSFTGLIYDLVNKPSDKSWLPYIEESVTKEQRYTYFGIVMVILALYMLIIYRC